MAEVIAEVCAVLAGHRSGVAVVGEDLIQQFALAGACDDAGGQPVEGVIGVGGIFIRLFIQNAGCRATSIQKFLGHKKLNSTMIYARVHDQTVAEDYYAAMGSVERRLALTEDEKQPGRLQDSEREQVLAIAAQLAQPEVDHNMRMDLAQQICLILVRTDPVFPEFLATGRELMPVEHPPPV